MTHYIGALDLGTTGTRFIVFDHDGQIAGLDQKAHERIFPQPGWVEHDPMEIWRNSQDVIRGAPANASIRSRQIKALGITNQRETTIRAARLRSTAWKVPSPLPAL